MNLWEELQNKCLTKYIETNDPVGIFSYDGLKGAEILGEIISEIIPKKNCLDIGCGLLSKPAYMKSGVNFIGIDPYKGDKREFKFIQGYAEKLPFRENIFDGVVFATSLDHVKDPVKAAQEAYRVLKKDGHLFFWGGIKKYDKKFKTWEATPKPAKYDDNHIWAYTLETLSELLYKFELINSIKIRSNVNGETIMIFKK